jgi:hypothetical protein
MGHYMRFLLTDPTPFDLTTLGAALRGSDPTYDPHFESTAGTLFRSGTPIAAFEVNTPGDGLFEEELSELEEFAADGQGPGEARVADALATAQAIVAVQVLAAASAPDGSLDSLDPVWDWLFTNRRGLLQSDAEGYYDKTGLIFEVA